MNGFDHIRLLIAAVVAGLMSAAAAPVFAQYTPDKAGLVEAVHDYNINGWWQSIITDRMFDFRLSPGCWQKLNEKDGWGIKTISNAANSVGVYMKTKGWGDLEEAESANNNDRDNNKPRVEQMIDQAKDKLHFTLVADKIECTSAHWDLVHRMFGTAFEALEQGTWKPRFGEVYLTITFSPAAKDIAVAVNPDGKHFAITAPVQTEPDEWDQKIVKGLNRVPAAAANSGKNR